jgi:hypothetical protein
MTAMRMLRPEQKVADPRLLPKGLGDLAAERSGEVEIP